MPVFLISAGAGALVMTIDVVAQTAISLLLERAAEQALTTLGAYIMRDERRSLAPSKKPARPGRPPHGHTREMERSVRFAYDKSTRSVVVGPTPLAGKPGTAPTALELGGTSTAVRGRKTKTIRVRSHPYAAPALAKNQSKLPAIYANSIRG